jgi:hypothetical protein
MFDNTREFLKKIGLPSGDLNHLPNSNKKFSDDETWRARSAVEEPAIGVR